MKAQDVVYIKKICEEKHSSELWARRAQVMAMNLKPLKLAAEGKDSIPFDALEEMLKSMVAKYDIAVGTIMTITDVTGTMTYHAGIATASTDKNTGKRKWLFTVHSETMYEMYMKLVLMTFVTIKEKRVGLRKEPKFMRKD